MPCALFMASTCPLPPAPWPLPRYSPGGRQYDRVLQWLKHPQTPSGKLMLLHTCPAVPLSKIETMLYIRETMLFGPSRYHCAETPIRPNQNARFSRMMGLAAQQLPEHPKLFSKMPIAVIASTTSSCPGKLLGLAGQVTMAERSEKNGSCLAELNNNVCL